DESAPRIVADPPAKSVAPVPRLMPRNVRRVIPLSTRFCFAFGDSSDITTRYFYGNRYQRQRTLPSRKYVAAAVSTSFSQYQMFRRNPIFLSKDQFPSRWRR